VPLPIVKDGATWRFDTKTGIHETILRRIGRNELAVLGVMKGVVAASRSIRRSSARSPPSCAANRASRMGSIGKP
jgi:hypothetical protein